ncbi:MAG: MotA/TolQ/ExbB proton channel family protein [Planctomycetota bacterium]|jgi:biopolymer transport protein ExbB
MSKSFWVRTSAVVIGLAAVVGLIAGVMRSVFGGAGAGLSQRPTFFEQFVVAGGPIVWFVLLPMSLVMVYLAIEHGITIRRKRLFPEGVGRRIIEIAGQSGPGQLQERIGGWRDFVSRAIVRAVSQGRGDWFRVRNLVFESLEEQGFRLMRKVEWLNLIGNVSPMVGLFGTVFGMIKLFNAIVAAGGQPQPAQLADGISVALVTTFWGLLIAIPALAIHGMLRNRIEGLISGATAEAEDILPEVMRRLKDERARVQQGTVEPQAIKREIREVPGKPGRAFREQRLPSV